MEFTVLHNVTVSLPTRQGIPDHHILLKEMEVTVRETEKMETHTNNDAFSDGVKKIHSRRLATGEDVANNRNKLSCMILNIKFPL
jgi:hypothetical protein